MAKGFLEVLRDKKFYVSLGLDALGFVSYLHPLLEFTDIALAPITAAWIYHAYRDLPMVMLVLAEEGLPSTDFVPSCLISHYRHLRGESEEPAEKTIERYERILERF
ncbi:MAG: hypothetical protein ACTSX6_06045 [Candidatus Heimdallarchaeaceae archaeon]